MIFDPVLLKFWDAHKRDLVKWTTRGGFGCLDASQAFVKFVDDRKMRMNTTVIKIGHFKKFKKVGGFIKVDKLDYQNIDIHLEPELEDMKARGFSLTKKEDIDAYIGIKTEQDSTFSDDILYIPHSWVIWDTVGKEIHLDPSGFLPHAYGKGQFDDLVIDKNNILKRYSIDGFSV